MQHKNIASASPQELLYGSLREQKYCDVLIDRLAGYPLQEEIAALDPKTVQLCPLLDPLFAEAPDDAPLLVRLPQAEGELIEKFLAHALTEANDPSNQSRAVCAFIFSPLEQAKLGKHLTRQLNAKVQSYGSIYFRYFDPRVIRHLSRLLSAEQLAGMLHGVRNWGYISWQGQFNAIQEPSAKEHPHSPFMTLPQWEALERIEAINATLRTLQLAEVILTQDDDDRIEAQIIKVKSAGLLLAEDQVTYAAYSIKFGETFTRHSDLHKFIGIAVDKKVSLGDVLEQRANSTLQSDSFNNLSNQRASA